MKKPTAFSGKWTSGKSLIEVNLPVIMFEEDGTQIVYCPALDLSGYGTSDPEALNSFQIALGEFFLYTTNKKTLQQTLQEMGWIIKKSKVKPIIPPSLSSLLETNDNFQRIFDNYPFRKVDQSFNIPALA